MNLSATEALVFEKKLRELGYRKYFTGYENCEYSYWKKFEKGTDEFDDEIAGYQIGVTFYDFSKYPQNEDPTPIHLNYRFLLGDNSSIDRLDITINDKKMTIKKFETFCKDFYIDFFKKEAVI